MRLTRFVVPDFPVFLQQTGVREGTVVVAISRDAAGKPDDTLVLESTDERFTEAALEAIRAWRFEPAEKIPAPPIEALVPVVRFFFSSGNVSMVPVSSSSPLGGRRRVRADTPIELPNFSHLDATPRALQRPDPEFPVALRGRVARGTALVKFFVDAEGRVRVPVAISATEPEFGEAAVAAIRQWRFEPPHIDGKPVIAIEGQFFQFGPPAVPPGNTP